MSSVFPHQTPVEHTPREHSDVVVQQDDPTDVLDVLSSETAQAVVATLSDDPTTASDVAEAVDTSLQNVQYHLSHLEEAGLVEPVDTWYSARGKPMTVYGLSSERLVVQFGTE